MGMDSLGQFVKLFYWITILYKIIRTCKTCRTCTYDSNWFLQLLLIWFYSLKLRLAALTFIVC